MGAKSLLDVAGTGAVDVEGSPSDPADVIAPGTPLREASHDAPASDAETGDEAEHEKEAAHIAAIPARVQDETLHLAASPMTIVQTPVRKPTDATGETAPKQVRFSETVMSIPDEAQVQTSATSPSPSADQEETKKAEAEPQTQPADCIVSVHRRLCQDWLDDLFTILHFELSTLATSVQAIRTHSTKVSYAAMMRYIIS